MRAEFEAPDTVLAHGVLLDVTEFDRIETAMRSVTGRLGPVDGLVNNVGYASEGALKESPLGKLVRQFKVNVFGAMAMIRAVLRSMRTRRNGHIFNIMSIVGCVASPGLIEQDEPLLHLLLGKDARHVVRERLSTLNVEIDA